MQEESNGELALFDNLLSKTVGIFKALSYKKPTNTERYTNYNSNIIKLQRKERLFLV